MVASNTKEGRLISKAPTELPNWGLGPTNRAKQMSSTPSYSAVQRRSPATDMEEKPFQNITTVHTESMKEAQWNSAT